MNLYIRKTAAACLVLLFTAAQTAAAPRILTVRSVIKKMERALSGLQDFQASYRLTNGKYTSSGRIYYMKPFFLRVNSMTDGCQLVTNGKMLWIMVPRYGVVAEQELIKSDSKYKMLLRHYREIPAPHETRLLVPLHRQREDGPAILHF